LSTLINKSTCLSTYYHNIPVENWRKAAQIVVCDKKADKKANIMLDDFRKIKRSFLENYPYRQSAT